MIPKSGNRFSEKIMLLRTRADRASLHCLLWRTALTCRRRCAAADACVRLFRVAVGAIVPAPGPSAGAAGRSSRSGRTRRGRLARRSALDALPYLVRGAAAAPAFRFAPACAGPCGIPDFSDHRCPLSPSSAGANDRRMATARAAQTCESTRTSGVSAERWEKEKSRAHGRVARMAGNRGRMLTAVALPGRNNLA